MGTSRFAWLACALLGCTLTDLDYLDASGGASASTATATATTSGTSGTTSTVGTSTASTTTATTASSTTTGSTSTGMPTYGDLVLSDAPIAYYPLDEQSGTTAFDVSGNVHHGVYFGGTTLGASAAAPGLGTSLELAGAPGGVRIIGSFTEFEGTAPFSLEAWFAPTAYPHDYLFLVAKNGYDAGGLRQHYGVYVHDIDGLQVERWVDGTGTDAGGPLPALDAWHHVVAVFDGVDLLLYLDGALVDTTPDTRAQPLKNVPLFIGARDDAAGTLFAKIDEVAIYDKALPAARIAAHHAAVFP